jgi:hypothetical protein
VSAYLRKDAAYQAIGEQQQQLTGEAAPMMRDTPMFQTYERVAPRPGDFPRLLDKMGAWMAEDFDFTDQFRALQVPTLYVAAGSPSYWQASIVRKCRSGMLVAAAISSTLRPWASRAIRSCSPTGGTGPFAEISSSPFTQSPPAGGRNTLVYSSHSGGKYPFCNAF